MLTLQGNSIKTLRFLSIDREIVKLGMKDTVRNSFIALPIVAIFEIIMILRWVIGNSRQANLHSVPNLIGYISLLTVTLITLGFIYWVKKEFEKRYSIMVIVQSIFGCVFVCWALWMTFVGHHYGGYFEHLVYVTIVTIVPVFCFISPFIWIFIQLSSAGIMLYMASFYEHFNSFMINFLVFTFISVVASYSLFHIRFNSYKKQMDLAEETKLKNRYAYYDVLTDLPNRRSYLEAIAKMNECTDESLVLAMFDVNGLKKINDSLGHDAGDELLIGASQCLRAAFGAYGTIYRVGGDEFMGIFNMDEETIKQSINNLSLITASWKGNQVKELSISAGTALRKDHMNISMNELEILADNAMYDIKEEYYNSLK